MSCSISRIPSHAPPRSSRHGCRNTARSPSLAEGKKKPSFYKDFLEQGAKETEEDEGEDEDEGEEK